MFGSGHNSGQKGQESSSLLPRAGSPMGPDQVVRPVSSSEPSEQGSHGCNAEGETEVVIRRNETSVGALQTGPGCTEHTHSGCRGAAGVRSTPRGGDPR